MKHLMKIFPISLFTPRYNSHAALTVQAEIFLIKFRSEKIFSLKKRFT